MAAYLSRIGFPVDAVHVLGAIKRSRASAASIRSKFGSTPRVYRAACRVRPASARDLGLKFVLGQVDDGVVLFNFDQHPLASADI